MLQPCGALLPISPPQSLRLPVAHLQELAGIYNPQMLAPHPRQNFHPSQLLLAHLCPPQSDLLLEVLLRGHFYFGQKGTLLSWRNIQAQVEPRGLKPRKGRKQIRVVLGEENRYFFTCNSSLMMASITGLRISCVTLCNTSGFIF